MKNPRLAWGIILLVFLLAYSFVLGISPEEHRYISGAKDGGDSSPGYYFILRSISNYAGYELTIRIIKFAFIGIFLLFAFLILEKRGKLNNLILFLFYPSFISLIFTQDKNMLTLALIFAGISNMLPYYLAPMFGAVTATFYGLQAFIFYPILAFFKDKFIINNGLKWINIGLVLAFMIMNIAWWGYLGFHQSSSDHEEVGLVNTILMLGIICSLDWSMAGTISMIISILLFCLGFQYWAYRPMEFMALNAVVNGEGEIILKTLSVYWMAWTGKLKK
jgi:hypothetical protein